MCQTRRTRSPQLDVLATWKFAVLVIASRRLLRGALPNGVPKMDCASNAFKMKCSLAAVTVLAVAPLLAFRAVKSYTVLGEAPQTVAVPNRQPASAATT